MYTLKMNKGRDTITLGKKEDGSYPVLSSSLETPDRSLGIDPDACADGVVNQDYGSDLECLGLSNQVEVDGCVIGTGAMRAKNLDLLQVALRKVRFVSFDPGDI